MKKLILAATLMALSIPAFAAEYELCNTVERIQSGNPHKEQTLIQDHGRFFVVYAVENGVAHKTGARSPNLKPRNDGTAYGSIVYGPGYLSEGFKGSHYYAISDKANHIDHAFSDCAPAPKEMYAELDAADKSRKEQMNAPKKTAPALPTVQHYNYKCEDGVTAFISDDKGSVLVYEQNAMKTFILDRHDAALDADIYQDNGTFIQLFKTDTGVTINFGHGAAVECTKAN
ncbi:hypothetical protein LT875_002473 [Salmonella enterica]|nr:hypothetical protein [Salmonella enterica]